MIKTPLSTVIGGAFWTPGATILGAFGTKKTLSQLIKSLFANNEQGFAYDPNDLTTMFQDAAGTVPVTGAGQPVGLILDKSGRGNHASQTVSASRPILQRNATTGAYYLAFDGADDFLVTNTVDFTMTDKVSLFAGVRKLSDNVGALVEFSNNSYAGIKTFGLISNQTPISKNYLFRSSGSIMSEGFTPDNSFPSPISNVLTAIASISGDSLKLKVDGRLEKESTQDQGTGNYGNYPLYIGRRGGITLPFSGHIYSLIGIGRLTTTAETTSLEKLIAKNTGVILSV